MASSTQDIFARHSSKAAVTRTAKTNGNAVVYACPAVQARRVMRTVVEIYNEISQR